MIITYMMTGIAKMEGGFQNYGLQSVLLWGYLWSIALVLHAGCDLMSYTIEIFLQFNFGCKCGLVKFIEISECRHCPENLFFGMQALK
jgi:hypothetical protein